MDFQYTDLKELQEEYNDNKRWEQIIEDYNEEIGDSGTIICSNFVPLPKIDYKQIQINLTKEIKVDA